MLTDDERRRGADSLAQAERELKPIPQLSRTFPNIELVDAYAIQGLWAQARVAQGARIVGHKIGLTSRAMQMASITSIGSGSPSFMPKGVAFTTMSQPAGSLEPAVICSFG